MANIVIGTVTLTRNPREMTLVKPDKASAVKQTHSGVAYFGWPATIVGKVIDLTWDTLNADEFASLDTIYAADVPVVFNPQDGLGRTYNVNVLSLDGKYLLGLDNAHASFREEVKMQLLIMSQV